MCFSSLNKALFIEVDILTEQKILLVGPVYPYKGGIAHYNSLLYRSLKDKYDTTLISFKRLYPSFLYPGKTQKDYQNKTFQVKNVEYLIDSLNPVSWLLTVKKVLSQKPELIIFQWWNPFFAPAYLVIIIFSKMFLTTKVLFICHNVFPHEKIPLDKFFMKALLRKSNFFIVQSKEDEANLLRIVPDANYKLTPHPSYSIFKSANISKEEARAILGIPDAEKVLLYFGFVRKYKGLIYLIRALPFVIEEFPDIRLIIAGEFFDEKTKYLKEIEKLNLQRSIEIFDKYIPDQEVATYFTSSDLVVLPYVTATQSGIVQIAYGFNKPVVVTSVGGLPEVVKHNQTGYVVHPQRPQQIADAILDYFIKNNESKFINNISEQQERFSWRRMIETIEELCFRVS